MPRIEDVSAREFCQTINASQYDFLREVIVPEIQATKNARFMGSSMIENARRTRRFVESLLAAELYPDDETPKLVVAENESETHEALRKRCPSLSPRLSAEQFTLKNLPQITFLSLDCAILSAGITDLPTKMQLPAIVNWLFSQNIVPVDAEYRMITYVKNKLVLTPSTTRT